MRDYLDGLVERTVDRDSGIRPRVPSIFEPRQPPADAGAADDTLTRAASAHTVDANTPERRTSPLPTVHSGPVAAAACDVRSQTSPAREAARDDEQLTRRLAALERMARRGQAAQADVRHDGPSPAPVSAARLVPARDHAPKAKPRPDEPPRTSHTGSPRVPEIVNRALPRAAPAEAPSALHRAAPPTRSTIAAAAERGARPASADAADAGPTPKTDAAIAAARHQPPALMPRAASMRPVVDMRPRRQALQPSRHTLVQVTIGRVEVRAEHDARPPQSSRVESGTPATLDEYMRRRHGAAR